MRRLSLLALAGFAAIALAPAAQAADVGAPEIRGPLVETPIDTGGFYLRGDIGLSSQSAKGWQYNPNPPLGITNATYQHALSSTAFLGAGIGYAFNSWFRADLTVEYRAGGRFNGRDVLVGAQSYENVLTANLTSVVGLLNGYVDLGKWWGITPYVGAGIGYAHNSMSATYDTGVVVGVGPSSGVINGGTAGGFAWALMAGMAWDVSASTKVELGYRYLNLGTYRSGSPCPACTTAVRNYEIRDVVAHDIRLGLRYNLSTPPIAAAPIVARY